MSDPGFGGNLLCSTNLVSGDYLHILYQTMNLVSTYLSDVNCHPVIALKRVPKIDFGIHFGSPGGGSGAPNERSFEKSAKSRIMWPCQGIMRFRGSTIEPKSLQDRSKKASGSTSAPKPTLRAYKIAPGVLPEAPGGQKQNFGRAQERPRTSKC